MAATTHGGNPWSDEELTTPLDKDTWELYDLSKDFTQHDDVAKDHPEKLKQLKELFHAEAKKHNVLPLDDRGAARFSAQLSGRPLGAIEGLTKLTYYPGMTRLPEGSAPDVKKRSFVLTAEIETPQQGGDGVIITQGGLFAGWVLMVQDGKPQFVYNWLQEQIIPIAGKDALAPGKHVIRFEFTYDGGGRGKGGKGVLSVDSKPVAEGRIEKTVPNRFSLDETLDVGEDTGTPVSREYKVPFKFSGKLVKVTVELE
jgi:arylsulfatase